MMGCQVTVLGFDFWRIVMHFSHSPHRVITSKNSTPWNFLWQKMSSLSRMGRCNPGPTLKPAASQLPGPSGHRYREAANLRHCMNSSPEKPGQKPQINNAIFYLNSYLCEAKSSPENLVLFISIGEEVEEEETNHLGQCVCLFVRLCSNIQYSNTWAVLCVSPIARIGLKYVHFCVYKNAFASCMNSLRLWYLYVFARLKGNLHLFMCECMYVCAFQWLSERGGMCEHEC